MGSKSVIVINRANEEMNTGNPRETVYMKVLLGKFSQRLLLENRKKNIITLGKENIVNQNKKL
jgi:hypothetical protein